MNILGQIDIWTAIGNLGFTTAIAALLIWRMTVREDRMGKRINELEDEIRNDLKTVIVEQATCIKENTAAHRETKAAIDIAVAKAEEQSNFLKGFLVRTGKDLVGGSSDSLVVPGG